MVFAIFNHKKHPIRFDLQSLVWGAA